MGKIKTAQIKKITKKLIAEHSALFRKDFESNKKIVNKLIEYRSKKLRNVIAGYVTRLMNQETHKPSILKPNKVLIEDKI